MRLAVCLILVTFPVSVRAQDASEPPLPTEATAPAEETPAEKKEADPPPKDEDLAKKLAEGLESLDPVAKDRDLLEEAIRGMRKAQERIEGSQTDEETRKLQKQVVKDLDELIKQIEQQLQNPQNQSQSKQNQDQQPKPLASVEKPKPKPMPKPAGAKPEPQSAKPRQGEGAETSESQAERERKAAEEARRRKLNQDVWGHLPEHVRKQLANIQSDKYLPKYAESVRQYFDALAEQSRDR